MSSVKDMIEATHQGKRYTERSRLASLLERLFALLSSDVSAAKTYANALKVNVNASKVSLDVESLLSNDEVTRQARRLKADCQ